MFLTVVSVIFFFRGFVAGRFEPEGDRVRLVRPWCNPSFLLLSVGFFPSARLSAVSFLMTPPHPPLKKSKTSPADPHCMGELGSPSPFFYDPLRFEKYVQNLDCLRSAKLSPDFIALPSSAHPERRGRPPRD